MDTELHLAVKARKVISGLAGITLGRAWIILLLLTLPGRGAAASPISPPGPGLTLALTGDLMLGRAVQATRQQAAQAAGRDPGWAWEKAFAALAPDLATSDLALANLESPLTRSASATPGYDLRGLPENASALQLAGFDLLSLANNHALDGGREGQVETRRALKGAGLLPVGPGLKPLLIQSKGLRLAFFAFDDISEPLDLAAIGRAVAAARSAGCLVIVSVHWGTEYQAQPNARQQQVAAALASAGASLVWGHHPHVLQPLAWLPGPPGSGPTLVAYSLGNALFDQVVPLDTRLGALLRVRLDAGGVRLVSALPFEIDPFQGVIRPASPPSARAVLERLHLGGK